MMDKVRNIAGIVLAAGASRRMGRAKMTLPYHGNTVLGTILTTLHEAGLKSLITVVGGAKGEVEAALRALPFEVKTAYNPGFAENEMLDSMKLGMVELPDDADAFLMVLGDQPQIQASVVKAILTEYQSTGHDLIIPSYQMRRGHPWLVNRPLWPALMSLTQGQTMRDFLHQQQDAIHYLVVDTPSILQDIDTPEDYQKALGSV
jgi:molybdenum cofactor cytidylyltransferase